MSFSEGGTVVRGAGRSFLIFRFRLRPLPPHGVVLLETGRHPAVSHPQHAFSLAVADDR